MTRYQIFRQTSVDLFFSVRHCWAFPDNYIEKKIFRQKSYGMDISCSSFELTVSGQGKIPTKLLSIVFLLVIFLWTVEHFPTREYSEKKSKRRFSPDNSFFLTCLNRWIRQEIKFPDKSPRSFLSWIYSELLRVLNSRFPKKEKFWQKSDVAFLPTIFF